MARLRGRERLSGRQRLTPFGNALEAPLKWGFTQSSSGLRRAGGYWTNHGEKTKLSADQVAGESVLPVPRPRPQAALWALASVSSLPGGSRSLEDELFSADTGALG